MKKRCFYIIFLFSLSAFAQGEANHWYFGQHAGLDFNGTEPVPQLGALNTYEGCASFSDKNGNLLFYTDGIKVWNRNHGLMPNGRALLGNPSSTQSAIIVPHPGKSNEYYIFTVGTRVDDGLPGLKSYVVDMNANNGLGDVVSGPRNLSGTRDANWTEKVTSVKGRECSTFWVISLVENSYYAYKVDNNGLNTTPVISNVSHFTNDRRGYLKISPDGKKLTNANFNTRQSEVGDGKCILYSFNDLTGEVENDGIELISNTALDGEPYGVEFSPLSSKLYISTYDGSQFYKLFQFDLEEDDIPNSKTLIHRESGYRGGLQLAPNGKIYATIPFSYDVGTPFLDAINNPDKKGAACNFEINAISLGSGKAMQGLPPFISSILLPIEIKDTFSEENINKTTVKRCIGEDYTMSTQQIDGTPQFNWIFKDSVISRNPSLQLKNLSKADEGIYYLEVETIDECGFRISYKGEVELEVFPPPQIGEIENIVQCIDDPSGFDDIDLHALKTSEILNGQSDLIFEVLFFPNELDAINLENTIETLYTNTSPFSSERIYARIQNINNPVCFEIGSFLFEVYEKPNPPDNLKKLTTCDSNLSGTDIDGFEVFNLTSKNQEILNGQKASNFIISYYTDLNHTVEIQNPTQYKNENRTNQTIYVYIANTQNLDCNQNSSFEIEVYELPPRIDSFTLSQCDEDGVSDGTTDFNLEEANDYLTLGDPTLDVKYYLSKSNAENELDEIDPAPFSNAQGSTVFARVENLNGCFRVTEVNLLVSTTFIQSSFIHEITFCDDDENIDGLSYFDLTTAIPIVLNEVPSDQNLEVSFYRNLSDAQLEMNEIPQSQPYYSEVPNNQKIFVRVESLDNGACYGIGPFLELNVNARPVFELEQDVIYCQNLPPKVLSALNPEDDYTYQWYDDNGTIISSERSATIQKEGLYTVIATSVNGCESFPQTTLVKPSVIATISLDDIKITDDSQNNSILINTENLGLGEYEYVLNDSLGFYQDEPFFDGLLPGIHTLFIRDKKGCGTSFIEVSVIGFPQFFTPNDDGYNDKWEVLGLHEQFYESAIIHIFDRFGKVIATFDLISEGWDGTFKGKKVPASDYWFTTELIDQKGNLRFRKGHFSLIRR